MKNWQEKKKKRKKVKQFKETMTSISMNILYIMGISQVVLLVKNWLPMQES